MAVSFEEVAHAIELLLTKQEKFTLLEVRATLGDKGSMSTISKHVQKWRSEKFVSNKAPLDNMQPAPDSIMEAVTSVWQNMSHQSTQKLEEKEQEIDDISKKYSEELNSMKESLEQSQRQVNALQLEKNSHISKISTLEQTIHQCHRELLKLKEDKAELIKINESNIKEIQLAVTKINELSDKRNEELIKENKKTVDNLKSQISQLIALNEEQRIEGLKHQESLHQEIRMITKTKLTAEFCGETRKEIDRLYQCGTEVLGTQQEIISKVNAFENIYRYKIKWEFGTTNCPYQVKVALP